LVAREIKSISKSVYYQGFRVILGKHEPQRQTEFSQMTKAKHIAAKMNKNRERKKHTEKLPNSVSINRVEWKP